MNTAFDTSDFDAAMRAAYRQAGHTVPWQLQVRLRPQAVPMPRQSRARRPVWLAAAGTTACALLIAAVLLQMPQPSSVDATAPGVAASIPPPSNDVTASTSIDMLDLDPAFYAWLGSDDARLMAME